MPIKPEEEGLQIVQCTKTQRDRAMILVTWETAGSPIEVLGLRIKDEALRQICNPSKLERVKEELANVLVYCFSLANVCDIDVTDAVVNRSALPLI